MLSLIRTPKNYGFFALLCTAAFLLSGCSQQPVAQAQGSNAAAGVNQVIYKGIAAGITPEGFPYLGSADAPITLEEYSDFQCPYCARHFSQAFPTLMQKYIQSGQVKYVFRDMPLASLHPTSPQAHAAARCVAEQGATLFWAMHDTLFTNQEQWRSLPDPATYLAEAAKNAGADTAAYQACLAAGRSQTAVQQSIAAGSALGFNGTPSFQFIVNRSGKTYQLVGANPVDSYTQMIDTLLAGKEPSQPTPAPTAAPAELPLWANPRGLAPDPARPGFDLAGDPYKGSPQAKVVVVEFSNFQCPACQKHTLEAQPAIDKVLVDTGQVLWVFKNLPLRSEPQSTAAAAAAECAGEQGKFWQMHDLLFANQSQWAIDPPDPALTALAGQLKLDAAKFSACLAGRRALERVLNDLYDAQGVATTTPTFVVITGGKGTLMQGSRPSDEFIKTLQGFIDTANDKNTQSMP